MLDIRIVPYPMGDTTRYSVARGGKELAAHLTFDEAVRVAAALEPHPKPEPQENPMSKIEVHYLNQEEPGHDRESREARRAKPCRVTRDGEAVADNLTEPEALRVAGALGQPLTAAEAVYGLFAWLTTNAGLITCGSNYDAAPLGQMVIAFCKAHNLGDVTATWPKGLESSPTHDPCEPVEGAESEPKPKRVYIAGPITGMEDYNREAFERAAASLTAAGFEPVSPLENGLPRETDHAGHMRADLALLLGCDFICALSGWARSTGACLEVTIADAIGVERLDLGEVPA